MTIASQTDAIELVEPTATTRGRVLVLQGRGDAPEHYGRLARRLAADGYVVGVAEAAPSDVRSAVRQWEAFVASAGAHAGLPHVAIAADTAAGLVATALADGALERTPDALVLAGTAVAVPVPAEAEGDALELRSACPVHAGVVRASGASPLASSGIHPVWPSGSASLPVLAIHGEADRIAPLADVRVQLVAWAPELVVVAGGLHDVLNDVAHRSVAAEIVQLLERVRLDAAAAPILVRERLA